VIFALLHKSIKEMKINKINYQRFNSSDTLLVISSFPLLGEEIALRNAVSRYTHLLLKHFPTQQRVIVLCEKVPGKDNSAYLLNKNILVLPTYDWNNPLLFKQLHKKIKDFNLVKNILLQFEFSLFGKEIITFSLPFFFLWQKLMGKKVYTMLHQVVLDLSTLSGQVNLKTSSLKTFFFNLAMLFFYSVFALASEKIFIHDQFLAEKLSLLMPKKKTLVIPHGINGYKSFKHKEKVVIKKRLSLPADTKIVLAYGYQSWYKGTDWLIKNFLSLKKTGKIGSDVKLLLAGDVAPTQKNQAHLINYYKNLSKLIRNNSDHILSTGFVPEDKVAEVFAIADLVVFPYRSRMSSSGALALALQYKKPFIFSNFFGENLATDEMVLLAKKLKINIKNLQFKLNSKSFTKTFLLNWQNKIVAKKMSNFAGVISKEHDWNKVAEQYLDATFTSESKASQLNGELAYSRTSV